MRLLVIEDDDTLRESLAEQLAEAGYAIEQAAVFNPEAGRRIDDDVVEFHSGRSG